MRTYTLIVGLILAACGPAEPVRMVSRCGAQFIGSYPAGDEVPGWDEESFQDLENATVEALSKVVNDVRFTQNHICNQLRGVRIFVFPEESFPRAAYTPDLRLPAHLSQHQQEDLVGGLSDCQAGNMILSLYPAGIRFSGYPHEVAHFTQACNPRPDPAATFKNQDEADHSNWIHDGIFAAIDKVQHP